MTQRVAAEAASLAASSPGGWRPFLVRRLLPGLLSVAIVVLVFVYFLPQFTSLSDVWAAIRAMTWLEVTTLTLLAVWNLVTYWIIDVLTTPGLTYPQAAVATETSTAISNTVPGGAAVGVGLNYAVLGSWGFSRSRISVSLLVAGVWNTFAKLGIPVIALALLAFSGGAGGAVLVAGVVGVALLAASIVVFGLLLRSEHMAGRIGFTAARVVSALLRRLGRPRVHGWELATTRFRARTVLLLRARWHWITAATLVSHLSLWLVLLVALRHVGVSEAQLSWIEVLAVFAVARLLTVIPITPGGVGFVEVALIASLAAAGGPRAEVAAAVLVFRALTYVLPIPLGIATYVFWRRNRSWRRPPNTAPRTDLVPEST